MVVFIQVKAQRKTHVRFMDEQPTLVSLEQGDIETSLCLANPSGTSFVKPSNALIDSGAEVKIMISETIAKSLGLTWDKDSVKLVGIGGDGGALGQSDQSIRLFLGGYKGNAAKATPFTGCFSVMVRPLIMTPRLERDIKHEVLIGQGLLHLCLGSMDCYMRHLEYSPAWLSDACPEFRVRVPCKMTHAPAARVNVLLSGFADGGNSIEELLAHNPNSAVMLARRRNAEGAATRSGRRGYQQSKRVHKEPAVVLPVPFHPGFPQGPMPTPAESKSYHDALMERKREGRAQAKNAMAQAASGALSGAPKTLKPTHLTFAVADLRAAGVLAQDGSLLLPAGRAAQQQHNAEPAVEVAMEGTPTPATVSGVGPVAPVVAPVPPTTSPAPTAAQDQPQAQTTQHNKGPQTRSQTKAQQQPGNGNQPVVGVAASTSRHPRTSVVLNTQRSKKPTTYGPYGPADAWMAMKGISQEECLRMATASPPTPRASQPPTGKAPFGSLPHDVAQQARTALAVAAAMAGVTPATASSDTPCVAPANIIEAAFWQVSLALFAITILVMVFARIGKFRTSPIRTFMVAVVALATSAAAIDLSMSAKRASDAWDGLLRSGWAQPLTAMFIATGLGAVADYCARERMLFRRAQFL